MKTVGLMRKTRHRGTDLVGWMFQFTATAYNLVRMRNLSALVACTNASSAHPTHIDQLIEPRLCRRLSFFYTQDSFPHPTYRPQHCFFRSLQEIVSAGNH